MNPQASPVVEAPEANPTEPADDQPGTHDTAADPTTGAASRGRRMAAGVLRWVVSLGAALLIYAAFLVAKGADPAEVLEAMWDSAFGSADSIGETFLRAAPLLLAALAVTVPARGGLFNIGGEGQLVLGAVGAAGMAFALDGGLPTAPTLVLMGLAAAAAGGAWAFIPAALNQLTSTNEAITSLLLNYVARTFLVFLVFEPWKDPRSLGQAYTESLTGPERLPIIWGNRVNIGIFVALLAAVVIWLLFRSTSWGFRLKVLGGNPEAARRAGFRVGRMALGAMVLGGALAGLGGFVEVAGVEGRLRPDVMVGYGYIGFLASWLARHHPLKAVLASVVLGAIAVGGNGLKISAGLSGAAVNILMALVLIAVLGFARTNKEATA